MKAEECVLFSGAANGAESEFGAAAERRGIDEVNFTFEGHKDARGRGIRVLTHEELIHGDVSLAYVSKLMHRHYADTRLFKKVLQSIWHQVNSPGMLIDDYRHFLNKKAVRKMIGRDAEVIKRGSPLKRASEIRAPVLLFHGDQDLNVSIKHSKKMAKALKRAKKSVEFIEYEDVEHSIRRNGYRVDMLDRIGSFLDSHIGQPATAP